ncbi:MAG: ABC transporter ATP-binding protein [Chloroflexi bacterium]|nr:ABC transporter ATP-binding protein [Chloroflexota bacterium]MCH8877268.1 ABC transporter ATP-binding protein [Chloroflexota bacterium]
MSDHAALVDIRDVVKDYEGPQGPIHALKRVNLRVGAGEFVGIRGPSGSGKSTLLNMITGVDRPTAGQVLINGQDLTELNEDRLARWRGDTVGVVFQFFQLLPTLTVLENVILPMDFARRGRPKERLERAQMLLEQVGLADQAQKFPNALSGGQQQRAAIARALANDPPLLVGDEPTGNLDSKTAHGVVDTFEELVARGKTFLMVTHSNSLAARIPRVIEVLDGELFENGARSGK